MPISANSACTCSSVALNERFPTYNFFTAVLLGPREHGTLSAAEERSFRARLSRKIPAFCRPARLSPGTHEHLAATTPCSQQPRRSKRLQRQKGPERARTTASCSVPQKSSAADPRQSVVRCAQALRRFPCLEP